MGGEEGSKVRHLRKEARGLFSKVSQGETKNVEFGFSEL